MTFWDHLEELRGCLLRIVIAVLLCAVAAFALRDPLFDIVLAPKRDSFITYRLLERLVGTLPPFKVEMVNIELAQQFLIHVKVSLWAALLAVSPYILFVLMRFVSPALYTGERKLTLRAVGAGYLLFLCGMLLAYFVIFPLTVRFLATYQVSADVPNVVSLGSYVSAFLMLLLLMGVVFELPVACWLLGRLGLLDVDAMRRYRRHAIVAIVILAAVITPTGDVFTLMVVALPIYLLYEVGIRVVARSAAPCKQR